MDDIERGVRSGLRLGLRLGFGGLAVVGGVLLAFAWLPWWTFPVVLFGAAKAISWLVRD